MGIMNLLAELHQEHDLKLNLKFEIEVLCKTLSLELHTLQPGNLLKDYDKLTQMLNVPAFGVPLPRPKQPPLMGPPPGATGAPPQISTSSGNRMMTPSGGPMDHMSGIPSMSSNPMMPLGQTGPFAQGPAGTGASGAGFGAALMSTPQQQPLPGPQGFMPPTSQSVYMDPANPAEMPMTSQGGQVPGSLGTPGTGNLLRPVEPKFSFTEINTTNLNGIVPHISIDSRLTLFKDQPDMVQLIKIAIEKSIQEWATPVIERANKIALTTTEQIVKKDFALDPDESRMRAAAHNMVRNLTSGMAMITCRDHLLLSIKNHLKNFMVTLGRNLTQQVISRKKYLKHFESIKRFCH